MLKKATFLNSVFKILLITLFFNAIVIIFLLYLILFVFSTANKETTFKFIYDSIEDINQIDIQDDEFDKIIRFAENNECNIEVYNTNQNERIYPSSPKLDLREVDLEAVFQEALNGNSLCLLKNSSESNKLSALNGAYRQMSMLIQKDDGLYILVQSPLNTYAAYYDIGVKTIIASFFISFLIACFMTIFFSNNVFDDIKEIKRISGKMAKKDFSEKCIAKSNDELNSVAEAMNEIAFSLREYIQNADEAERILKEDIERRKKIEQSQKDFVSNVSHELKTPISIISGYTEGIKYELVSSKEDITVYCDTILSECNRMTSIVKRLLALSTMENHVNLDLKSNNISELLRTLIERYKIKSPERIFVEKIENNLFAVCDLVQIEQVLINYLDNAIKYSAGEITVLAYKKQQEDGNYVYIGIENKGSHIDESEKENIWNKFYRADQSHQRDSLSVGLGLSIVKATMERHNMPYGVSNTENGVEFFIMLKKPNNNT